MARPWRGCFGLGLASFAANTWQSSGEKAGGDIDFAVFYILPVPSSLSAKWRRVEIGSLPSFSPSHRIAPKHPLHSRALTLPDATPILTLTDSNLTLPSLRGNGIAISSAP